MTSRIDFRTAFRLFAKALVRAMGDGDATAIAAFEGYITPFIEAEVATWPLWSDAWRAKL